MTFRIALIAGLTAVALAAPSPAVAQTSTTDVNASVVDSLLSMEIAAPPPMTLTPGMTPSALVNQTTSASTITSTSAWYLWVKEAAGDGAMSLLNNSANTTAGCAGASRSVLSNALRVFTTGAAGELGSLNNSPTPIILSSSSQKIAHGELAQEVTANYRQPLPASEQLRSACEYGLTATYTLTATDSAPG